MLLCCRQALCPLPAQNQHWTLLLPLLWQCLALPLCHRALAKMLPVRSTELLLPTYSHTWQEQAMLKVKCLWAGAMLEGSWAHYSLLQLETERIVVRPYPTRAPQLRDYQYTQPKSAAHLIVSMSKPSTVISLPEPNQVVWLIVIVPGFSQ